MPVSTISSAVRTSVTLGSAYYAATLTVTGTGSVKPTAYGAAAVYATAPGDALVNYGVIKGGVGTAGIDGGVGLILAGGTAVNGDLIAGGQGSGDNGGAGVYLNGGTLTNAGTIRGGSAGGAAYQAGDAVLFGTAAGTLVIDPGAVFKGEVVANATVDDVLVLGGTGTQGKLAGLGISFTGFSAVLETQGADWLLKGSNTLDAALTVGGFLTVSDALNDAGNATIATIATGGTLLAAAHGTISLGDVVLSGGKLTGGRGGTVIVGGTTAAQSGALTVQTGASIDGYGSIVDKVGNDLIVDNGTIEASGGTLMLDGPVTGQGTLDIAFGAEMVLLGATAVSDVDFLSGSNGTLYLASTASLTGPVTGLGIGDAIDISGISATGLMFQNGTLSLTANDGATLLRSLVLSGTYVPADFALMAGPTGSTEVLCVSTPYGTDVTLPGGNGSTLNAYVSASAALNYVDDIQTQFRAHPPTAFSVLSSGQAESSVAGAINEIFTELSAATFTLGTGGQFSFVSASNATTLYGSASGGDSVVGGNDLTYYAGGDDNQVIFTQGNNVYNGSIHASGDTIVGGSGNDIINTGGGPATVFSGTGNTQITLNDTTSSGDIALMENGTTTVHANGGHDTISASAPGTIFGGAGSLLVTFGGPAAITVIGGSAGENIFGVAGTSVTLSNTEADQGGTFIAGSGNETLNGAGAAGGFSFFADTVSADTVAYSVTGGSGFDFFDTGVGNENFTCGPGAAQLEINTVYGGGASVTINDFGANDYVNFYGLSVQQETSLLATASVVSDGNLTVSLPDGSQVEFVAVTSLSGHLF